MLAEIYARRNIFRGLKGANARNVGMPRRQGKAVIHRQRADVAAAIACVVFAVLLKPDSANRARTGFREHRDTRAPTVTKLLLLLLLL